MGNDAFANSAEYLDGIVNLPEQTAPKPDLPPGALDAMLGLFQSNKDVSDAASNDINLTLTRYADSRFSGITVTPPQTAKTNPGPTKGAHALVLDVSYSMDDDAKITNDSGDKVTHGWSLLDIVKHAACTYIQSLGDEDYVRIITYASEAKVQVEWTSCTKSGKKLLDDKIRCLRTEGTTNLRDGIALGMNSFLTENMPKEIAERPQHFAKLLAVCTDGCPTAEYHPPGGAIGYATFVKGLAETVEEQAGPLAVPTVTSIAFGNSLDSVLLHSFSDTFLHIPDPGSVGPFMVNLIAATRSTAKVHSIGAPGTVLTATHSRLILEPAAHVIAAPGYTLMPWRNGKAVALALGSLLYDGPRHIVLQASPAPLTVTIEVGGHEVARTSDTGEAVAMDAAFAAQVDRTAAVCAMQKLQPKSSDSPGESPLPQMTKDLRRLSEVVADGPLKQTLTSEVLLAVECEKFKMWGRHYLLTLPGMLRSERRSNFRDACLQPFGKDSSGCEGLFEELSNGAELCFATLKPPEPSKVRSTSASRPLPSRMPDEFMRGGGCFGPNGLVTVAFPDGNTCEKRVADVRAGDALLCEGGGAAEVLCVVRTETNGGRAELARLPNGLEITPWHPVRYGAIWHFPILRGQQIVRTTPFVYNFVLAPGVPTILVNGLPCAALGHGLQDDVVKHSYWGTTKVIDDMKAMAGWAGGDILLPATRRAPEQDAGPQAPRAVAALGA